MILTTYSSLDEYIRQSEYIMIKDEYEYDYVYNEECDYYYYNSNENI